MGTFDELNEEWSKLREELRREREFSRSADPLKNTYFLTLNKFRLALEILGKMELPPYAQVVISQALVI